MSNTGSGIVSHCATEVFLGNFFTSNGLNNCWSGNEHFRSVLYHVDEVSQSWGINSAASRWSHDCGNLWNYTGSNSVFKEDLAVTSKSINSLLDTSAAGIVHANEWSTHFQCQTLYFYDFSCMHFAKGTTFNGEILSEYINQTAINSTITGGYAFTREFFFLHAEVCATMCNEAIEFNKAAFIKKQCDSFASSQFAAVVLFLNTFWAASCNDFF